MKRLEFAPKSPFQNIHGTAANLRANHPGISDHGVNQAVKRMLMGSRLTRLDNNTTQQVHPGYKPRTKWRVVHLFGADIMTADLTQIPAWNWIAPGEKGRLVMHPITSGVTIPDDLTGKDRRDAQEILAKQYPPSGINRSVLIGLPGLQQTYVWRIENGWMQEVTDHDYDLITSTPSNLQMFSNPDINGEYVPARSYAAPGQVIGTTKKGGNPKQDIDYLMRHMSSTPHWQGVDVGEES
jgi:hypothetical protein